MFGNDGNRKSGKPVRGYRWMYFTFFMIVILCLIVIFHESYEKLKQDVVDKTKGAVGDAVDWAGNGRPDDEDSEAYRNNHPDDASSNTE